MSTDPFDITATEVITETAASKVQATAEIQFRQAADPDFTEEVLELLATPEVVEESPDPTTTVDVHSVGTIQPGSRGMLACKLQATAQLVDITTDEGTELVRILASKVDLELRDPKLTVREILKSKKPLLKAGFVTLIVINKTKVAKPIKVVMSVVAEIRENKKSPAKIIGVKAIRTQQVQRRILPPVKSILVNKKLKAAPGSPHLKSPTTVVLPREGEQAVLMLRGHVLGLIRFLRFHVRLHPSFVPTILRQIAMGIRHSGAVTIGGNETAVVLPAEQLMKLHAVVTHRSNHLSADDTEIIAARLQEAAERMITITVPAQTTPLLAASM